MSHGELDFARAADRRSRPFGRPRILIVGCGDVGLRVASLFAPTHKVLALTRDAERAQLLRAMGATAIAADLDDRRTLWPAAAQAPWVVHLAPPPSDGTSDRRTRYLTTVLQHVERLVYVSTTGVYGDCQGARIDETRRPNPTTDRARRRIDAEAELKRFARRSGASLSILRAPGIYSRTRLPLERIRRGTPALVPGSDVYTNHIHADDLARAVRMALYRGAPGRIVNVCDGHDLLMGEYFDVVARAYGLAPVPRMERERLRTQVGEGLYSFMNESRRIGNRRLVGELGVVLRYPDIGAAIASFASGS